MHTTGVRRRTRRHRSPRLRIAVAAVAMVAVTGVGVAAAAVAQPHSITGGGVISMSITGISGEGTSRGPGYIEVNSYQWGLSHASSSTSGGGAGKAKLSEFSITKSVDKATPLLYLACAGGQRLAKVAIFVDPPGAAGEVSGDGLVITLTNAFVTTVSLSSGGDRPTESVSFNYQKIAVDYFVQSTGAPIHFGWDLKSNGLF